MEMIEDVGMIIFGVLFIIFAVIGVISLVLWIFQAIGLQAIAKKNNIKNAWLAWLPIGDLWILGKISDTRKTFWKIKDTGKMFVILSLVQVISVIVYIVGVVVLTISSISSGELLDNAIFSFMSKSSFELMDFFIGVSSGLIILLKIWSLYNVYYKYKEEKVIGLLICSIIFSFIIPFVLFSFRKKEELILENNVETY